MLSHSPRQLDTAAKLYRDSVKLPEARIHRIDKFASKVSLSLGCDVSRAAIGRAALIRDVSRSTVVRAALASSREDAEHTRPKEVTAEETRAALVIHEKQVES
jgi:hypothetical protein